MVFDTNVLVHAADRHSAYCEQCRRQVHRARRDSEPAFLTWSVCYELLRVTSHPRVFRSPWNAETAYRFIASLLSSSGFQMLVATPRHSTVLKQALSELPNLRGSVMHDLHTAVLMGENGIGRICTRDNDFRRFPFLTVLDPLGES